MKRVILFRFHKSISICKNRLELLKKFNPAIQIFGLYGGREGDYRKFCKALKPYLKDNYCIKNKSNDWKWENGDLAVMLWYKKIGQYLNFDMLHIIEWDLLLLDSLDKIYRQIPKNGIGLTALTLLKNVEDKWDWTSKKPQKNEWDRLLNFVKVNFSYKQEPYASFGPGTCLPKKFLEKYANTQIPELCHDELRLPLFGQIFGFRLYNTGFYKEWFNKEEQEFFNCEPKPISISIVLRELKKASGRRVFHPYRKVLKIK